MSSNTLIVKSLGDLAALFSKLKPHAGVRWLQITAKFAKDTRSVEQNAKLWSMLRDVSNQVVWHGSKLSSEDWKHVFTAALKGQRMVPGIESGMVMLGRATSRMTIEQMSDLIEFMYAFGVDNDVEWSE